MTMTKSDLKAQDRSGTTDIAPMQKKVRESPKVKIDFGEIAGHALISTRDKRVWILVPAQMIERKFPKGERPMVAYFRAQISNTVSALEICDRWHPEPEQQW